jgi:signal peptidase II
MAYCSLRSEHYTVISPRGALHRNPVNRPCPVHAYAVLLGISGTTVLLDQLTKAVVTSSLAHSSVELLGGAVLLDLTRNTGAAFSTFPGGGLAFTIIAVVVCGGIVLFYRQAAGDSRLLAVALGLVLGGAAGNLTDRVRLGYVVDFIDLRWWPVFNLADSAIVIGVALLLLRSFLSDRSR